MTATSKPVRAQTRSAGDLKRIKELIGEHGIQVIDVKFCDLPGTWQHFSIPAASLDEDMVKEGLGFDGSSIRGFPGDQRVRHAADAGPVDPPSSIRC